MGLGRLALGWDLANNRFLVKLNNIPHEELRPFVKDVRICRQKVVNTAEGNVRNTLWFLLYGIQSVVVQAQFNAKRKAVSVTVGREGKTTKRGRFDDPSIYPIAI